jgi:ribosomal protein L11 methyltransferase
LSREPTIAFRLASPASDEDMATAVLFDLGTLGIEVGEGAPGSVTLLAFFPAGTLTLATLRSCLADLPEVQVDEAAVPAVDWVARFRDGFRAFDAGGFRVAPPWDAPAPDGRTLIVDPGRAFGTGTHESTRLCLRALESVAARRALGRVLDVGCGTGILGVAAARLGGCPVVCVDVDAEAVASAALHARLNHVDLRIVQGDGCRAIVGRFDLVTANIAAGPLLERRDELWAALASAGTLVLSGMLEVDAGGVLSAYRDLGPAEVMTDGEWAAALLRRSAG